MALPETPNPAEAPVGSMPSDIRSEALRLAGKVDRELRRGDKTDLAPSKTRFDRFGEAVAAAYIDRSKAETRARFESPDGTVYTIITVGGKSECYMSGPVGINGSRGPAKITCPSDARSWARY